MEGDPKKMSGEYAVKFVENGMVVGLGTGSTVAYTIRLIGEKVKNGLDIIGIPTSNETEKLALSLGIALSNLEEHPAVDVTIDGADEVDAGLNLIKGMGGALLREKIVAKASKLEVIVVDDSKFVERLGTKSPLPVEVLPFGWSKAAEELKGFGCSVALRRSGDRPLVTDNGNHILDCKFEVIEEPGIIERDLNNIPGVIENGLFVGLADLAVVARTEGIEELRKK
jgi:ribose 5-phosphate isomerase A